jgi:hypothetical protein
MSRNPILTSIKLLPDHAILGERPSHHLAYLANVSVRVELATDASG